MVDGGFISTALLYFPGHWLGESPRGYGDLFDKTRSHNDHMGLPIRKRLYHDRPDWADESDPIFITICGQPRGFNQFATDGLWPWLIQSCEHVHLADAWRPKLFLAMPDHLHLITSIPKHTGIDYTISYFKAHVSIHEEVNWQMGFFDHRLRNRNQLRAKWNYVLQNPVRAGFCSTPDEWPYLKKW